MRPQTASVVKKPCAGRAWPCRRFLFVSCSLAILCGTPANTPAQKSAFTKVAGPAAFSSIDTSQTIPLVMSFSGGISLGSYQAGVNWALIQFINLVRRDEQYRTSRFLPHLKIAAMTGASAGNINALLAALQYCDTTQTQVATSSLFWKAWINTGWNELLPESSLRASGQGVFDRRHFRAYIEPEVARAMETPVHEKGCEVPLGIIVTKLMPTRLPLDDKATVETQRHIALFDARSVAGQIHFAPSKSYLVSDPSLGAQIALPVQDDGNLRPATVFSVVEASAAFPVAFGPVLISYMDPSCTAATDHPEHCPVGKPQSFIDGGVFDNNPMGLALGMARDAIAHQKKHASGEQAPNAVSVPLPHLIYVDPNALREPWSSFAASRQLDAVDSRDYGVSAVLRLVTGFVPTAREYELQILARSLRSPKPNVADSLFPVALVGATSRGHPLVGEHLGQFAAFLGRPFREFDFWVGVADAVDFLANQVLCEATRVKAREDSTRTDEDPLLTPSMDRHDCARAEADNLLESRLELGSGGTETVSRVRHREDSSVPIRYVPRNVVNDMARVLGAVERATASRMQYREAPVCTGSLAHNLLCSDEFDSVLIELSRDSVHVRNMVSVWAGRPACKAAVGDSLRVHCMAEPILAHLFQDREAAAQEIVDDVLTRMQAIEEGRQGNRRQQFKAQVKAAEFLYRSTDHTYHIGWDGDPSSIPPHDTGVWRAMHFLPYYVGGGLGSDGFVFGWQPMIHLNRYLATVIPLEAAHLPHELAGLRRDAWYEAISPGLAWKTPWLVLGQVQAGARFMTGPYHVLEPWQLPTVEFGALFLAGKVRVTAYPAPELLQVGRKYHWLGTISLADANGILYWLLR